MSQAAQQPVTYIRFYDFGPFRVDAVNRLLMRGVHVVPLTSKVFDVLLLFVTNTGQMLDKNEMMKRLWPDSCVEEGNLTRNVSTLRKALGERPNEHRYIVTVPGRGYCFVASVRAIADQDLTLISYEQASLKVAVEEKQAADPFAGSLEQVKLTAAPLAATRAGITVRRGLLIPLITTSCLVMIAVATYHSRMSRPKGSIAFREVALTSLTSTGNVYIPVISPDGKYLAYCALESGGAGLRVEQVATRSVLQLVPPAPVQFWGISWSRDSEYVYYVVGTAGPGNLYIESRLWAVILKNFQKAVEHLYPRTANVWLLAASLLENTNSLSPTKMPRMNTSSLL